MFFFIFESAFVQSGKVTKTSRKDTVAYMKKTKKKFHS